MSMRSNIADPAHVAYLTQTTLSLDETKDIVARLEESFPLIRGPKSQDICYATENRQMAVKGVAQFCDLLLVVGSANSSNSKRLVEVGQNYGVQSFLVNDWSDVDPAWLDRREERRRHRRRVRPGTPGGTNRAAPCRTEGYGQLEEVEMVEEDVRFSLPPELATPPRQRLYSISQMTPVLQLGAPSLHVKENLLAAARENLNRAADHLLSLQHPDGYWCALLTADTTLESDYILLQLWLHPPVNGVWNPPNRGRINRAVERILSRQLPDGGFNIYVKGPSEISASVKAYFALKLAGLAC